jgi:3-hydroxyacyl-[acyl-carrier-protein] dehydratase
VATELRRPASFAASWTLGPRDAAGGFEATVVLSDPAPFAGHYPGSPLLPGNLLIEALFQAASAALGGGWRIEEIGSARFQAPLLPGDLLKARFTVADDGASKVVEAAAEGRAEAGAFRLRLCRMDASTALEASQELKPGMTWVQAEREGKPVEPAFIRRVLPHRFPMLLLDRAVVCEAASNKPVLVGRKAVTVSEPSYSTLGALETFGYPASLLAESFVQACAILKASTAPAGEARDPSKVPVIAKLAKLKFLAEAQPGDVLEHRVRLAARMPDGAVFSGETVVGGKVVLQVERVVAATAQLPGR